MLRISTSFWFVGCVSLAALAGPGASPGSQPVTLPANPPRPELTVPKATTRPAMDASPDDPAWRQAAVIESLTLSTQADPAAKALPTRVRVLWSDDFLYVRFECDDPAVFAPHGDTRDAHHYEGDVAEVFLDPVGDARQWFEVQQNPAGGVLDLVTVLSAEPKTGPDLALQPWMWGREMWPDFGYAMNKLQTCAKVQPDGTGDGYRWIADFALPAPAVLRRQGRKKYAPMTLRANFLRYDGPVDAASGKRKYLIPMNWGPVRSGLPHVSPAAMGYLHLAPGPESVPAPAGGPPPR